MRCSKAQKLLSDLHNGELSPRNESAVQQHIAGCVVCHEMSMAYGEMMEMLARAEQPELPADFEGRVHMRLATENAYASQVAARKAMAHRGQPPHGGTDRRIGPSA